MINEKIENPSTNKVPVLFLIFKRKDEALKAFETIREYKPERLYIAADGPRANVKGEREYCEETRKAVLEAIDWDCKVQTLLRDKNLGCTQAVYGGISWFFEHERWGVINEDDVVISHDFFKLCEVLLPYYEENHEIMLISSRNHSGKYSVSDEYLFTRYANIWGWASWRRAWKLNPNHFDSWKDYPKTKLIKRFGLLQGLMTIYYYNQCADPKKKLESWDYTWSYIINSHEGICICPKVNLSSNVGIGVGGGTNYQDGDQDPYAHLKVGHIKWPLKMREHIEEDKEQLKADRKDFLRLRILGIKKKLRRIIK